MAAAGVGVCWRVLAWIAEWSVQYSPVLSSRHTLVPRSHADLPRPAELQQVCE